MINFEVDDNVMITELADGQHLCLVTFIYTLETFLPYSTKYLFSLSLPIATISVKAEITDCLYRVETLIFFSRILLIVKFFYINQCHLLLKNEFLSVASQLKSTKVLLT